MNIEKTVQFLCNEESLTGILHLPAKEEAVFPGRAEFVIVIVVGGPQYRVGSHRLFVLLARFLAKQGFAVFRFDHRGIGDSSGELVSFEKIEPDIQSAISAVKKLLPAHEIILLGLCDAASAVSMYCVGNSGIAGLILLNPWVRTPEGMAETYARFYYLKRLKQLDFWKKVFSFQWEMRESVTGFMQTVRTILNSKNESIRQALSYLEVMRSGLQKRNIWVLIALSEDDYVAREFELLLQNDENWNELVQRNNIEIRTIRGADHTFSGENDLNKLQTTLKPWLDKQKALEDGETK